MKLKLKTGKTYIDPKGGSHADAKLVIKDVRHDELYKSASITFAIYRDDAHIGEINPLLPGTHVTPLFAFTFKVCYALHPSEFVTTNKVVDAACYDNCFANTDNDFVCAKNYLLTMKPDSGATGNPEWDDWELDS